MAFCPEDYLVIGRTFSAIENWMVAQYGSKLRWEPGWATGIAPNIEGSILESSGDDSFRTLASIVEDVASHEQLICGVLSEGPLNVQMRLDPVTTKMASAAPLYAGKGSKRRPSLQSLHQPVVAWTRTAFGASDGRTELSHGLPATDIDGECRKDVNLDRHRIMPAMRKLPKWLNKEIRDVSSGYRRMLGRGVLKS
ncbi:hypothetical protein SODALDRAFT_6603 [Sodiomyces alkalinus F11]|uniref:Uncharacterized protein n=1 Tax=Sodiomyces alkalinus (strain CBS 110278 / VKM F-3762 / F11) TaxID=1314773 RepID=A0A3N2Q5P0_SODAK|nr:hypothetical protein SODALDRAFT_6603 [Sodiomyces alkalinus F11]ROT42072.1 hypothetical protein SODALDRAFT_6603 [Sodiomyces alkalinus F11]